MNCPYCNAHVNLVDSSLIYNGRSYGPALVCSRYPVCDAYVGCHPGTNKPLGRLADKELRIAKMAAHKSFDPFWRSEGHTKTRKIKRLNAYRWLAEELGIKESDCHIGMMDVETCRRVVLICEAKND